MTGQQRSLSRQTHAELVAETFYAPTRDGWRLAIHHWPRRAEPRRRHPILMVHGLGANRLNMDLDEQYSVARAAARRGFDAFVLELRGAGLSMAPGGRNRRLFQWGFRDYAEIDMPAAIKAVLEVSGASSVHGLGHSMGGMLFYALGVRQPQYLRAIASVGTPLVEELELAPNEQRLVQLATRLTPASSQRRVPLRSLMHTAGRFIPVSRRLVDGLLLNANNTDSTVMARMAREAIDDIPLQLALELSRQMAARFNGKEGPPAYVYERELGKLTVPVYAVSGSADRLAPPSSVKACVRRIVNSPDVRYREMGVAFGDSANYGHIDLLVGRNAPQEVYPTLLDFLEEVD